MNYPFFKNKNRRIYSTLCLLLLFSISSYAQKSEGEKTEASKANIVKIESKDDLIMKELVTTFNQNNQQALNELKAQDLAKYTSLMNSIQDIYKIEKNILILTNTSFSKINEKDQKVGMIEKDKQMKKISLLKKELADIKNKYSLK